MNDHRELFERAWQILQDRQRWEQKQRLYYQMRHDGLRRRNKPFPSAADLHLALIDDAITKLKPFTLAQVLGGKRLATFVALRQQLAATTESAADFLSFELKNRTKFLSKLESVVDTMWLRGRGVLKTYVDPLDDYRIIFEPVDPLFILMPDSADDFDDSDEWVHVRQITVAKFRRDPRYNQDALDRVRGIRDAQQFQEMVARLRTSRDKNFEMIFADKELREGITHSRKDDTIILWEHYIRTAGGFTVYSYSPVAVDIPLRKPHGIPYKVAGKVSCPFTSFCAEVKDPGWYSPRGAAEKIAAHEQYACKVWNEKADAITYFNRPLVTSEQPIQNPANFRWQPGEYIPGNLKAVQLNQPAMSFEEELYFTRGEAEQAVQMPDFGIQRVSGRQGNKPRTATENQRIATLQNIGQNHNGALFGEKLCQVFRHVWGLMVMYKPAKLTYYVSEDLKELPPQALHDDYLVMPGGSTEDWDRAQLLQRAADRYQTFKGAPNIDQDALAREVLECDDARLVNKLLLPQNQRAASEAEDEAMEILVMQDGFPAAVRPGEDHATRINILLAWLQKQGMTRHPVDPTAMQRVHQHLAVHLQYLKQLQPDAYKAMLQKIAAMERQPMGAPAGTGPGGQGGPGGPAPAAAGLSNGRVHARTPRRPSRLKSVLE
ncbi:MAG: hypothetical protein KGL39_21350 [Patescibacteria group bacterium]|nr:hypothetical protein [Patescibacteria group bacterium]